MQNPLAKQRALLALRAQAAQWLAEYDAALIARGLGFTPEDVAAVEASHQARPTPTEKPGPLTFVSALWVGLKATFQSYPAELRADDPKLAPVAGLSFPAYATAAAAIGWATDDAALVASRHRCVGGPPGRLGGCHRGLDRADQGRRRDRDDVRPAVRPGRGAAHEGLPTEHVSPVAFRAGAGSALGVLSVRAVQGAGAKTL